MMNIAAQYGSVSDIEIHWTLVALVGALLSVYNVRDAVRDLLSVRKSHDRSRWKELSRVAWASILVEGARLVLQLIFLTIGILAMMIPDMAPPPGTPLKFVVLGAAIRWGLIVSGYLVLGQSVVNYRLRRKLLGDRSPHLRAVTGPS